MDRPENHSGVSGEGRLMRAANQEKKEAVAVRNRRKGRAMKKLILGIHILVMTIAMTFSPKAGPSGGRRNPLAGGVAPRLAANAAPGTVKIPLGCKNPGWRQGNSKTPLISNTTGRPIPMGATLYWAASDGDKGTLRLQNELAPNSSLRAVVAAGKGYSCQAWLFP